MNGTSYPLNLSEKCWALGLRTPEAIQKLYDDDKLMDKWSKDAMKDILRYADGEDEAKKEVEKLEKQVAELEYKNGLLVKDVAEWESKATCYGDYVELINDGTFTEWMKEKHPDEIWWDTEPEVDLADQL